MILDFWDLNVIIIVLAMLPPVCFYRIFMPCRICSCTFSCNKMPMRASGMSLGESVMVCFAIPVLPADLPALTPGYEVWPDLATTPFPLSICFLHSQSLQCWIKGPAQFGFGETVWGFFGCSFSYGQLTCQPALSNHALSRNHSRGSHCFHVK